MSTGENHHDLISFTPPLSGNDSPAKDVPVDDLISFTPPLSDNSNSAKDVPTNDPFESDPFSLATPIASFSGNNEPATLEPEPEQTPTPTQQQQQQQHSTDLLRFDDDCPVLSPVVVQDTQATQANDQQNISIEFGSSPFDDNPFALDLQQQQQQQQQQPTSIKLVYLVIGT